MILDSIGNALNLRQKKDENLQEYMQRFKTVMQVMDNQMGGPLFIPKFIDTLPKQKKPDSKTITEQSRQASTMFLHTFISTMQTRQILEPTTNALNTTLFG